MYRGWSGGFPLSREAGVIRQKGGWEGYAVLEHIPLGGTAAAAKEGIGFSGIYKTTGNNCNKEILLLKFKFVFDGSVYCFNKV